MDQLLAYELECRQKLQSGMVSGDYENFQHFILTLETAIAQHRQALNQWKEKLQQAIALWQSKQQRLNALSTLHSRQEQAEHLRENRLDQKKRQPYRQSRPAAVAPASAPSATDVAALFPTSLSGTTAATATPPSAMIASQLGSDEWQQAIEQQLVMFARNNQSNAELRLHPADLGTLQISLHMQDNQLQIHMVSDHAQVRDTLQAALPHLRTALAESGIQLGKISINYLFYSGH